MQIPVEFHTCGVREILFVDFEFGGKDGEQPKPYCVVALEYTTEKLHVIWLEGERCLQAPFPTGPGVMLVAYFASAEINCFLALNWKMPEFVIDLFPEFRILTNGKYLEHGNSLLGASSYFGLSGIASAQKDAMRARILKGPPFTPEEKGAILKYCQNDIDNLPQLFKNLMHNPAQYVPAIWRGAYVKALAGAEFTGIPIDVETYHDLATHWPTLESQLIDKVNRLIPVFEGEHLRIALFQEWLANRQLLEDWPATPSGAPSLDDDTLKEMGRHYPEIAQLREVRQLQAQMRTLKLTIGPDHRNRTLLSPFGSKTGRNTPKASQYIFGQPHCLRFLVRPEPGIALAYVDWSSQEFGIAAALSGDPKMLESYRSGDPYLSFARFAGAVPADATKASHPQPRELFKTCSLGSQYGITTWGLGARLNDARKAKDLLRDHHRVFHVYWEWISATLDFAQLKGYLVTTFGWRIDTLNANLRSLQNFLMQANGSEMLRIAMVYAAEMGVQVIAPVHDAFLIQAPESEIDRHVALMQQAMETASRIVLVGFPLRSEVQQVIRYPDRFLDEKGAETWRWLMESLGRLKAAAACLNSDGNVLQYREYRSPDSGRVGVRNPYPLGAKGVQNPNPRS
jgi:DNA polymerase I-like protein with 3'-5' exonuclease and polymerase domains